MDDIEQLVLNQLRRTDRAIESRRKKVAQIKDAPGTERVFNKRYVLDFSFDSSNYGDEVLALRKSRVLPQTRSFVVDRDCKRYFCQEIVASLLAVGSPYPVGEQEDTPPSQKYTLSPASAYLAMPYTWIVRDTSTDREWSDSPLPSTYVQQSHVGGYRLPSWALLEPGTELQVTVAPTFVANLVPGQVVYVSKIELSFSFVGFEVL